jgi:hypothetical protein
VQPACDANNAFTKFHLKTQLARETGDHVSPENKMLVHLPIVILATLHPTLVADTVPTFDVARECRFEGGTKPMQERCAADETQARNQLQSEWIQFGAGAKNQCNQETTADNSPSYVELLTCLEMERDVKNPPK